MIKLEQVKKIKWYKQSGAGIPFLIGMPFWAISEIMTKYSGFTFPNDIAIFKPSEGIAMWYHYFDLEESKVELQKILSKFEQDESFFPRLQEKSREALLRMENLGEKLIKLSIRNELFNQQLEEFMNAVLDFWGNALYLDLLDPFEKEIINFIFGDHTIKTAELNILMSPVELSCIQQEESDLLNIVQAYIDDLDTEVIDKLLKDHVKKYHWLKNDYLQVEYLDEKYFLNKVREIVANPRELKGIKSSLAKLKGVKKKQAELIKSFGLEDEVKQKLEFINLMVNYRDERKKANLISHYYLLTMLKNISSELNYDFQQLSQLLPLELKEFLKNPKNYDKGLAERLESGLVVFSKENSLKFLQKNIVGDYFKILENCFLSSEIKGSSAARGKVIGRAKLVLSQNDFDKVGNGDIIITSMTRPEFLPVMKKAAAIITDEGGITCHAAIISRELGIPCITGTQVATRLLKDGDLIDVNANHGVIKVISEEEE